MKVLIERLEALQVDNARDQNWSWQEIAVCLGVTRQAVHKKYAGGRGLLKGEVGMFERFSPQAREAVTSAQAEARRLHHNHIGTEHLLLGLMDQAHTLSGRLLAEHGLDRPGAERRSCAYSEQPTVARASWTLTHWRRSALTCRPSGTRSRQHSASERWIVTRPGPGRDA